MHGCNTVNTNLIIAIPVVGHEANTFFFTSLFENGSARMTVGSRERFKK